MDATRSHPLVCVLKREKRKDRRLTDKIFKTQAEIRDTVDDPDSFLGFCLYSMLDGLRAQRCAARKMIRLIRARLK